MKKNLKNAFAQGSDAWKATLKTSGQNKKMIPQKNAVAELGEAMRKLQKNAIQK